MTEKNKIRVGIDFDNTIICYDEVFNIVGRKLGLIPEDLPHGKSYVRDYLRNEGQENEWIRLQGLVYGKHLDDAGPYKGALEFMAYCSERKITCFVVSHKTKYPYSGDKYNLHKAAQKWINDRNIGCPVYFELTKENKIEKINELGCTHFIDDLPEFLDLQGFNRSITKILFDPQNRYADRQNDYCRLNTWDQIASMMMENAV